LDDPAARPSARVPPPFPDQLAVDVVEVEEPLQLRTRRLLHQSLRCGLLISQKFHRHAADGSPTSIREVLLQALLEGDSWPGVFSLAAAEL
jgi:hypothetical protein